MIRFRCYFEICVFSNYSWIEILRNVVIQMYLKSMKALLVRIFSSHSKKITKLVIITCGHFCLIACHYSPTDACVECIYRAYTHTHTCRCHDVCFTVRHLLYCIVFYYEPGIQQCNHWIYIIGSDCAICAFTPRPLM